MSYINRDINSMYPRQIFNTNLCKEIMLTGQQIISRDLGFFEDQFLTNVMQKRKKPEYKFSRAKWHTAQLHGNATWVFSDEYNQVIVWCTEQFGAHPVKQDAWSRWYVGLGYINFRDEADYILYQLRWA